MWAFFLPLWRVKGWILHFLDSLQPGCWCCVPLLRSLPWGNRHHEFSIYAGWFILSLLHILSNVRYLQNRHCQYYKEKTTDPQFWPGVLTSFSRNQEVGEGKTRREKTAVVTAEEEGKRRGSERCRRTNSVWGRHPIPWFHTRAWLLLSLGSGVSQSLAPYRRQASGHSACFWPRC